jgi:hypothetical protein
MLLLRESIGIGMVQEGGENVDGGVGGRMDADWIEWG